MGMKPGKPSRLRRGRPRPSARPAGLRPTPGRPKPLGPLRVSVVKYLNTAPLVWGLERGPLKGRYRLSYTVPAECAEALRRGTADVGIIPSIEYQTIPGLKIVPGIAIPS